jgi:hypothetical protein
VFAHGTATSVSISWCGLPCDGRKTFLHRLGQACESHGWKIHAWVLMGNPFHLLLETPQPNLVSGMK